MSQATQLKLIRHNGSGINLPDDPSFPYKLVIRFRPPGFLRNTFVDIHGNEELIVRGMTQQALEGFIQENNYRKHPRLIRLIITGPGGEIENLKR